MRMYNAAAAVPEVLVNGQVWQIHVADERAWKRNDPATEVTLQQLTAMWLVERAGRLLDPFEELRDWRPAAARWIFHPADWSLIKVDRVLQRRGVISVAHDGTETLFGVIVTCDVDRERGTAWLAIEAP